MGAIGLGGRGSGDLGWMLGASDVQFVAVCDVRKGNREGARNAVNGQYGNKDCATYRDFRELLAGRPDIDAMLIATGDRWHTPASIAAMQAGKDVYCEKPGALTIAQGQALVAATKLGDSTAKAQRHSAAEPQPKRQETRFNAEVAKGFAKGRRRKALSADLRAYHCVLGVIEIFAERDEVGR